MFANFTRLRSPSSRPLLMSSRSLSPLVHLSRLPHRSWFHGVPSIPARRNFWTAPKIFSVGQGNQGTTAPFSKIDLGAFKRYLEGHYTEPYGGQGKESRDRFIQLLANTFVSVAEADRSSYRDSSDPDKSIDVVEFLWNVFHQLGHALKQQPSLFGRPVYSSLLHWISRFISDALFTTSASGSNVPTGLLEASYDTIENFLDDYFHGNLDQSELATRTNPIVDDLVRWMEEVLSRLVSEQGLRDKSSGRVFPRPVDMRRQDGLGPKLTPEEWQNAWRQPFRGSSLMFLKQKLALNVDALQRAPPPSANTDSKLEMSRLIPIVQSSGSGKSRLAEEYVKDQFAVMLSLKNGHGFPFCVSLPFSFLADEMDKYVSEYFKDLLRLKSRFDDETPADPKALPGFDSEDTKTSISRFNDGFYEYHNSVYYGSWAHQRPGLTSIPMAWAAAGRLRVACFLAGFFEVMAMQMAPGKFDNLEHWRANFLHSQDVEFTKKNRDQFWFEVVKKALSKLRENDCKQLKQWILYGRATESEPKLANHEIGAALQKILRPSMLKFFESPIVTESLRHCSVEFNGRKWDLPFLFIVDEAAYLYQTNYLHSFMWVLDQPVVQILYQDILGPAAKRFFVLMLGTHSQISHFTPHHNFPSERYFTGKQHIPTVFATLDWDSGVQAPPSNAGFESSADIGRLVRWGRPLWLSYYNGCSELSDVDRLRVCVNFAMKKLTDGLPITSGDHNENDHEYPRKLVAFAVLALRIHLDLDFVHPARASKLVSSKMRWLVDVDPRRRYITTTYGSEPLLVEAAASLMNSHRLDPTLIPNDLSPVSLFLQELEDDLNRGHVDRGRNGELTALIMAKDQATRQVWWEDEAFLTHKQRDLGRKDFQRGTELYFCESDKFYEDPCSSSAFYHRAVKVKEFLKVLLQPEVYNQLQTHFGEAEKWKSLDNAYVNFTHFAPVASGPDSFAFTKDGFFAGWQRHVAYFLDKNFEAFDIAIPIAFRSHNDDTIDPNRLSFMVISIKNSEGNDMIREPVLPRECVEGVMSDGKPYTKDVNVALTLNKFKFINPDGIPGRVGTSDDAWVQTGPEKPFIAFAMSLGDTERRANLFIGEKTADYNTNRIAFALRGLTNTYNMYDAGIKRTITEINVRHDVSGRYPQSRPDYPLEKQVVEECRKPLDNVFAFTSYWKSGEKSDGDS